MSDPIMTQSAGSTTRERNRVAAALALIIALVLGLSAWTSPAAVASCYLALYNDFDMLTAPPDAAARCDQVAGAPATNRRR
jgi:hypothetical protein